MGSRASKNKAPPKSAEPAPQPAKKAAEPVPEVPKKAIAFEVDAPADPQRASAKMPSRLREKIEKASAENDISREDVEAKLAAAEQRREKQEQELKEKLREKHDSVDKIRKEQKEQGHAENNTAPPAQEVSKSAASNKSIKKK